MEQIETTGQLFQIIEEGQVFEPYTSVNGIAGKFMGFERFEDGDNGTFPTVTSYIKLANRIDKDGVSEYLTWVGKSKLKFNTGYCTVIRDSKHSDEAIIEFKEPIKVVVAEVNDEPVIIEVNRIHGSFTYEWGWLKNGKQDKIANVCEIYFDCKKYELKK